MFTPQAMLRDPEMIAFFNAVRSKHDKEVAAGAAEGEASAAGRGEPEKGVPTPQSRKKVVSAKAPPKKKAKTLATPSTLEMLAAASALTAAQERADVDDYEEGHEDTGEGGGELPSAAALDFVNSRIG